MSTDTIAAERLARLEVQMEHAVAPIDEIRATQKVIHAAMQQAQGAAWLARWLMPAATGVVGFVASQLGGYIHLPR